MKKPIVLIVDDDELNVRLLQALLSGKYEVTTAYSGKEALLEVENKPPDLILLDIMMPGISGYEVCKKLKDDKKTSYIPIVMVSALTEKSEKIKCIEAGADDFLSKPVDVNELMVRVKSLLRIKYYHDSLLEEQKRLLEIVTNLWD
jgi:two-component system cell cycle response regulator